MRKVGDSQDGKTISVEIGSMTLQAACPEANESPRNMNARNIVDKLQFPSLSFEVIVV